MSQGDVLAATLAATAALLLASRSLRSLRLSLKVTAGMVAAWALIIISGAMIAARWHG